MMIKGTWFQKKNPCLTPIKNPWFIIITGTERKATNPQTQKINFIDRCQHLHRQPLRTLEHHHTVLYCNPPAGPVMRPSTASVPFSQPQSQSQAQQSQSHPPPSAAQLARLADKKKEFEAVDALQRASALFLRRLEGLADDCEAMAEAGIGACLFPLIPLSIC